LSRDKQKPALLSGPAFLLALDPGDPLRPPPVPASLRLPPDLVLAYGARPAGLPGYGHRSATTPPRPAVPRAPRPGAPRHLTAQSTERDPHEAHTCNRRHHRSRFNCNGRLLEHTCGAADKRSYHGRRDAHGSRQLPRAAAQPETAGAAAAVAKQYFGLYSAGQFALSWTLLAPSAQRSVSKATWVAVHQGCPAQSAGLAYEVKDTTVTGNTAVSPCP
jgi:hypothetical protein